MVGSTRAYGHLILGNQHCQIVFSLDTKKPIVVISDQISCVNCSRKLTALMNDQKVKMIEIQYVNLEHEGAYYKNSNKSPAIAEEFACEKLITTCKKTKTTNSFLQTNVFLQQKLYLMVIPGVVTS